MLTKDAFVALNRFGLGIGPEDGRRVGRDPARWLKAQTLSPAALPAPLKSFPSSAEVLADIHRARLEGSEQLKKTTGQHYRKRFVAELLARAETAVTSPEPFRERMVLFWSNHFTVARSKAIIGPTLGAYEREAIRPHVFGRFEDLLIAVVQHPSMLSYLDNNVSMGPNSRAAKRRKRSLNENLAREILELHTLGVDGGYEQKDVTEFAKVLTGWTHGGMVPKKYRDRVHGEFVFRAVMHEPGTKQVLGRSYRENGVEEGLAVLRDLAAHPSTARFLARKLVRHFVADDPPAKAVQRIEQAYLESNGDLARVSQALIELEDPWQAPLTKVKSPYELVISTLRGVGIRKPKRVHVMLPLKTLGQEPFNAASPQGWPDTARHWLAPEALLRRIEWLRALAARVPLTETPDAAVERLLGPVASEATRLWVSRAPSADDALALTLASAEFQRR